MSGGSWDYVSGPIDGAADKLLKQKCPYRKALGRLLKPIAEALHDIEWVDSYNKSHPDEMPAIKRALGANAVGLALAEVVKDAEAVGAMLRDLIITAKGGTE